MGPEPKIGLLYSDQAREFLAATRRMAWVHHISTPGMPQTGYAFTFPKGAYGRIAPRSGLGAIDPDFTGELRVMIFNITLTMSFEFGPETG